MSKNKNVKADVVDVEYKEVNNTGEQPMLEDKETKKEKRSVKEFFKETIVPAGNKVCTVVGKIVVGGAAAAGAVYLGKKVADGLAGGLGSLRNFDGFDSDEETEDDENSVDTSDIDDVFGDTDNTIEF